MKKKCNAVETPVNYYFKKYEDLPRLGLEVSYSARLAGGAVSREANSSGGPGGVGACCAHSALSLPSVGLATVATAEAAWVGSLSWGASVCGVVEAGGAAVACCTSCVGLLAWAASGAGASARC